MFHVHKFSVLKEGSHLSQGRKNMHFAEDKVVSFGEVHKIENELHSQVTGIIEKFNQNINWQILANCRTEYI